MNQAFGGVQREMKKKQIVTILAIVAVSLMGFLFLTNFLYYDWTGNYNLAFEMPKAIELASILLYIAPSVMFVLYVLVFHKTGKGSVLMPIIFGTLILSVLFDAVAYPLAYGYDFDIESLIWDFLLIVAYSLAMVDAIRGFSKKILLTVGLGMAVILRFYFFTENVDVIPYYLDDEMYLYAFRFLASAFGAISLFVGLWFFGWNNTISIGQSTAQPNGYYTPAVQPNTYVPQQQYTAPQQQTVVYPNAKDSLVTLQQLLIDGLITEEEYQARRAEILKNL